ncbi:uroporphyrinogen-III C-methyltransferase [Candidatus Pyrohabitans sp.]
MKKVYLVGGGPGDPELITVKGMKLIQSADVIVYDRLVSRKLLAYAKPEAELIYVGKQAGRHTFTQEEINQLLIEKAEEGKLVVRLKGGDPFVFGRGGEEAIALRRQGIAVEVVPGVSSAIAVPALAGIPITHRGVASSVVLVTGHLAEKKEDRLDYASLKGDTIVILMGVKNLPKIIAEFRRSRSPGTPVAIIEKGTLEEQRVITGTLADIIDKAREAKLKPPAVTVIGEVVRLREEIL